MGLLEWKIIMHRSPGRECLSPKVTSGALFQLGLDYSLIDWLKARHHLARSYTRTLAVVWNFTVTRP